MFSKYLLLYFMMDYYDFTINKYLKYTDKNEVKPLRLNFFKYFCC